MSTFIFPETDKPRKLGQKEKIPGYVFADPDDPAIIYIKTCKGIELLDNSIYDVTIPDLTFVDDECTTIKQSFVTRMSPCYVDVDDVLTLLHHLPIDKSDIMRHIKTASEIANYWAFREDSMYPIVFTEENLKDDYYPFYMFIRYRAAVESLKEFYIGAVSRPEEFKDELSDLAREEKMNLDAIKDLIDDLNDTADEWLELVVIITADPEWALRGKYSIAITPQSFKPYHDTFIDRKGNSPWSRGY